MIYQNYDNLMINLVRLRPSSLVFGSISTPIIDQGPLIENVPFIQRICINGTFSINLQIQKEKEKFS